MTDEQWASLVAKDPRYAAVPRPAAGARPPAPCVHLRQALSARRRACARGHTGPDFPGVRPCRDCGPGKCPDYAPGDDD